MSPAQLIILRHALGRDVNGNVKPNSYKDFRRHFVTGPGSTDYDSCEALVESGFMSRRPASELSGGSDIFMVTNKGIEYVDNTAAPKGCAV